MSHTNIVVYVHKLYKVDNHEREETAACGAVCRCVMTATQHRESFITSAVIRECFSEMILIALGILQSALLLLLLCFFFLLIFLTQLTEVHNREILLDTS